MQWLFWWGTSIIGSDAPHGGGASIRLLFVSDRMTDYQRFDLRKSGEITIVDIKAKELSELDFQEQLRDELTDFVT